MKFTLRKLDERRKTNPKDLYFTSYRFPRPAMQIVEAAAIKLGISLNEAITQFIETFAAGKKKPKLSEIKVTKHASKHARDSYTKPAKKVKAKKAVKAKAKSAKKVSAKAGNMKKLKKAFAKGKAAFANDAKVATKRKAAKKARTAENDGASQQEIDNLKGSTPEPRGELNGAEQPSVGE